ncbi:hypothetical protein evm_004179 [Chilo suppressalis]|nr:hypothetical protein evm_004179 [Chilo suppressalis]
MPNCAVVNCNNTSKVVCRVRGDVSYHRFPRDSNTKEKWIDATGNKDWFPTKHSTICSMHFKEDDYVSTKKRRLFEKAYPTIQIVKTTSSEEEINQPSRTLEKPSLLNSPKKTKLSKIIKNQKLKIKRLQEQNRRKHKKNIILETIIECLKKKALITEEQAESLKVINVTTKELYFRQMKNLKTSPDGQIEEDLTPFTSTNCRGKWC